MLKEINPGIRAIMINAFGAVEMSMRIIPLGANNSQEKRIDLEEVLAEINSIENELQVAEDAEAAENPFESGLFGNKNGGERRHQPTTLFLRAGRRRQPVTTAETKWLGNIP